MNRLIPKKENLKKTGHALTGFLFTLPALTGFTLFVYRPLMETIYLSFHDWNMVSRTKKFIGWDNYKEILTSDSFYQALWNTGVYAIWLIVFIIFLPLLLSYGLTRVGKWERNLYRITLFAPTVVSLGIASVLFVWIFNPIGGFIASVIEMFGGIPLNWTSSLERAKTPIITVVAWKSLGYNMVLLLAGIGAVPEEVKQAAEIDGAVGLKLWRYIILPLISPTILTVFVLTISMSAEYVFTPIHVITGGGPQGVTTNVVFEIYRQAFQWFRVGLSSTFSVIVLGIFIALLGFKIKLSERIVSYEER